MDTLEKILNLMIENNCDNQQLATALNLNRQVVTDWRAGRSKSYQKYLYQIADYFNVSVDYLLGKSEMKTPDEELSQEQFALWGEVKDLTEEEKKKVLDFIKFTKSQREV